ncbi:Cysteine synthase [Seminavis robusta]|uniref:Cysteine synthase n=1 Tax=Seminavis robusta TaxID=568900 RepID=A0A9N8E097_9STRA|nr:Cysteine synthase [Seminavis robusta]|eukprot:Sro383_g131230.1 Cysteine synthase (387) ;mRNA; f:12393-13553
MLAAASIIPRSLHKGIQITRALKSRKISFSALPPHPPPLANSVLDTIGNTPLVRLDRFCQALGLRNGSSGSNNHNSKPLILAKLENTNPGMSKKDRIAHEIIRQAKAAGILQEGQPVVELTSGNTGTGLAMVCPLLGHPFCAVMSQGNSRERAQMMRFLGAEVVLVPQAPGSAANQVSGEDLALVEETAQKLCQDRQSFRIDQFVRKANADAHYLGTAREILEQVKDSPDVRIDGFVDFVGTGGSFAGCTKRFKEDCSHFVSCHIVEPEGISPLARKYTNQSDSNRSSGSSKNHVIQGGGYDMPELTLLEEVIQKGYVDGFLQVDNQGATDMARLLGKTEGIFGGFSAGANLHAAVQLIQSGQASQVVALICDSGSKYYSADLLPS